MLFSQPARAVILCLMLLPGVVLAVAPAVARSQSGSAATVAPAPRGPATGITTPEGSASDAAARHAKRTECLKEAKTKKLLGTAKSSYVKNCVAAR